MKPKTVSKYVHVYVKEAVALRDAAGPSVPDADALTITLPAPNQCLHTMEDSMEE